MAQLPAGSGPRQGCTVQQPADGHVVMRRRRRRESALCFHERSQAGESQDAAADDDGSVPSGEVGQKPAQAGRAAAGVRGEQVAREEGRSRGADHQGEQQERNLQPKVTAASQEHGCLTQPMPRHPACWGGS